MIYPSFVANLFAARINLAEDPIKAMLVTAAYTPSDKHASVADVQGEIEGKGYEAGGQLLKGERFKDGLFTARDLLWPETTIKGARRVVLYRVGRGDPLICCYDLPEEGNSTNDDFFVEWASEGIFELTIREG